MYPFIDIHTHSDQQTGVSLWRLKNILLGREDLLIDHPVSAGWHPWHINNVSLTEIESKLQHLADKKNVYAIGECGLDRTIKAPILFQLEVFKIHISVAAKIGKPIVMHCVKAYSDLLELLKKEKINIPIILHGFNGNDHQVEQLKQYNIYFSYGESILKDSGKLITSLRLSPLNRLFLETDESALSIEKIYIRAAEIKNIAIDALKKQLYLNFENVFGDGLVKQD